MNESLWKVGQGAQIDLSVSWVRTPKPVVENVEPVPTIDESQQEPANEVVLQAMLRVLE